MAAGEDDVPEDGRRCVELRGQPRALRVVAIGARALEPALIADAMTPFLAGLEARR